MADMGKLRMLLAFMLTCQLVYATSRGGTLGQIKCNCPPAGGGRGGSGSGSPVPTDPIYSSPPPAGGGRPATPSLTPPYSATPSPTTPRYNPPRSPPAPTFIAPPSPSRGGSSSPTTPSVPSYGGTPPSPSSSSSPSVPSYGSPPVPSSSSSSPPVVGTSPSPPTDPGVPSTPGGSTPSVPDLPPGGGITPGLPPGGGIIPGLPGSGTGTCNFWGSHPSLFPNILSIFGSIADLFGSGSFYPSKLGRGLTVQEALTNRRKDGYGSLLREGTASLLNSLVNPAFSFSPQDVKNQFNAALRSNKAAAVQGAKFKSANVGRPH